MTAIEAFAGLWIVSGLINVAGYDSDVCEGIEAANADAGRTATNWSVLARVIGGLALFVGGPLWSVCFMLWILARHR